MPVVGNDDRGDDVLGVGIGCRQGEFRSLLGAAREAGLGPARSAGYLVNNTRTGTRAGARRRAWPASPGPAIRAGRPPRLSGLALQLAPLPLGEPAPDPEALIMLQRILQALRPDLATTADSLCLPGGAALLREERLRVRLRAQRAILPAQRSGIVGADAPVLVHQRDDDVSHCAPPPLCNPVGPPGCADENYTSEITRACLAERQGRYVI